LPFHLSPLTFHSFWFVENFSSFYFFLFTFYFFLWGPGFVEKIQLKIQLAYNGNTMGIQDNSKPHFPAQNHCRLFVLSLTRAELWPLLVIDLIFSLDAIWLFAQLSKSYCKKE
ncbi:MAG: hypothetical protein R6U84_07185, partial [Candidatus Cloacimonadales bacterium]